MRRVAAVLPALLLLLVAGPLHAQLVHPIITVHPQSQSVELSAVRAIGAGSSVVAWGANTSGQTNVPADLANAIAVAAGNSHSFVLKFDGTVATWGGTNNGLAHIPVGLMSRWVKFCRWRKV